MLAVQLRARIPAERSELLRHWWDIGCIARVCRRRRTAESEIQSEPGQYQSGSIYAGGQLLVGISRHCRWQQCGLLPARNARLSGNWNYWVRMWDRIRSGHRPRLNGRDGFYQCSEWHSRTGFLDFTIPRSDRAAHGRAIRLPGGDAVSTTGFQRFSGPVL